MACSPSPDLCIYPYPVEYQTYALSSMIALKQQTLSWAGESFTSKGDFATYFSLCTSSLHWIISLSLLYLFLISWGLSCTKSQLWNKHCVIQNLILLTLFTENYPSPLEVKQAKRERNSPMETTALVHCACTGMIKFCSLFKSSL